MGRIRGLFVFVLFIFCNISFFADASSLRIHFLDVGEGDSILIQTSKDKTILVDAGNLITGFKVVEYLKKNNIHNLDYLIFTHSHLDHIGGAFFVVQMMEVKKVYDNGDDIAGLVQSQDVYRWYEQLVRKSSKYSVAKAEDTFLFDEVILKVLWPYHPFIFSNFNSNSLVIMIEHKSFRCLLAGDLTVEGEKGLLKKIGDLKADVLKVGHHGNDDATSQDFLRKVSPALAIISVNKDNIRGYPSEKVLQKMRNSKIKVYRTDKDGSIVITVEDDGSYSIETE